MSSLSLVTQVLFVMRTTTSSLNSTHGQVAIRQKPNLKIAVHAVKGNRRSADTNILPEITINKEPHKGCTKRKVVGREGEWGGGITPAFSFQCPAVSLAPFNGALSVESEPSSKSLFVRSRPASVETWQTESASPLSPDLVCHAPGGQPLEMSPLLIRALHAEADRAEQPEEPDDRCVQDGEDADLDALAEVARVPVDAEAGADDGEVESRVVVMDVSDTRHGDEGKVVEEPADDGVDAGVVDLIDLGPGELVVAPLPADAVPGEHDEEEAECESRAPVNDRVAEQEVFDNGIIPAAHAQSDVQERPLPWLRRKIVLFVRVRNKGVVGRHHGHVEMDEIAEEGRFVRAGVTRGHCDSVSTPISLCSHITGVVRLDTGRLDLLETPLRQIHVAGTEIAVHGWRLQTERSGQGADFATIVGSDVTDNLDLPMVLVVANGCVAITRDLVVRLCDRCRDLVGVQIPASLSMNQTNDVLVLDEFERCLWVVARPGAVGPQEPVVIGIFVMVASNLLLLGSFGVSLDVRVQKTTAVSHVLQRRTRSKCKLERTVSTDLGSSQVGLEQGRHLCIARAAVFEDQEV
nr:hypothetical protein CFP56_28576 [Quercus suber]